MSHLEVTSPSHLTDHHTSTTVNGNSQALEDALEHVYRYFDSYSRMDEVLTFKSRLNRVDWLRLLGEVWSDIDNTSMYYNRLRSILKTTGPIRELMTPDENAAYDALPETVTVYRGCGRVNMMGMSWSLDRETANSFPHKVEEPLLVTATVPKSRVLAVKLDRGEHEVLTFSAKLVYQEPSMPPTSEWWESRRRAAEADLFATL
jgi:hypothetical protein